MPSCTSGQDIDTCKGSAAAMRNSARAAPGLSGGVSTLRVVSFSQRPAHPRIGVPNKMMAQTLTTAPERLQELVGRLEAHPGFAEVLAALQAGHASTLGGVWGSSCALVAASLVRHAPGPLVVVYPHIDDLDDFADDLALFTPLNGPALSGLGARDRRRGRLTTRSTASGCGC